ncbi:MAG: serine/threonine protein kinase [Steroidobacteraceae bacterium]|jgi:serine/threonine-protein kinase|nr:serine/threonine protein kinase [Steroidobacteraceae bacterium]
MSGESPLGRWLRGASTTDTAVAVDGTVLPPLRRPLEAAVADLQQSRTTPLLRPGEPFGHYRVEKELGRGAMATVYRATDERSGRRVALKLLSLGEDWPEDRLDEARLRLRREAEAAARIEHPDIVEVFEAGEHEGQFYLAMEFVEGVSLDTHTYQGRLLPPRMTCEMCARVAEALHFAHQRGVVHRDIKPANIVFDQERRRVRIMDFGVARLADSRATRTGIVLGSPSYMAPEQLDGRPVSGRSDLFSLGVTLFQLLTGSLPFRSDSMTGLMRRIALEPHPPLVTIRPDLPATLGRILDRTLAKDPDDRFETGAEMGQALRQAGRTIDPGLR